MSGAAYLTDLARQLGVHHSQVYRWAKRGLTHRAADRVACRLGHMPYHLWPPWLWHESTSDPLNWSEVRRQAVAARRAAERLRQADTRAAMDDEGRQERRFQRAKQQREPIAPRPCAHCAGPFVPITRLQVYCRMSCAENGRAERRRVQQTTAASDTMGGHRAADVA